MKAQKQRFNGNYPLATPSKSESQIKAEYEKTVTAMLGGVRLMGLNTTPTSREDPEAFTKDDYKEVVEEMNVYAIELCQKLGTDYANKLKKISKAIKSNKFSSAESDLESIGAQSSKEAETIFFIWKEYLRDKENKAPWTDPENIKITRVYRAMLAYVSKNYERPFGAQAEQGAIIADAAQALSNCMENPTELAWKGESKMTMRKEDELRRLASNVSYYNWRMHNPISGKRAAQIDETVVRHLQQALYDVVRTTIENKDRWDNDPAHGANLLRLFEDTKGSGWTVNGDKAHKKN
ncbi:hypothetical protein [Aureispira anguillae]|uniref:hypothetical protein n=1 Tax=Aureispira anguillae TaxID=2864201 RepID=UPI002230FC10|nr:hypothetical protein [Aureispira anguillae]